MGSTTGVDGLEISGPVEDRFEEVLTAVLGDRPDRPDEQREHVRVTAGDDARARSASRWQCPTSTATS